MKVTLLLGLILLSFVGTVVCCRCSLTSDVERYCKADYAIIAKVLDKGTVTGITRKYRIRTYIVIKSKYPKGTVDFTRVHTAISSSMCGRILKKGSVYLLAGRFQGKIPTLGLCSIVSKIGRFRIGRVSRQYKRKRC